uniref:Fido domain-containing protein n=1 Tax=Strigamia maritima TaxID=126957 RepID=T1IMX3_STRMM
MESHSIVAPPSNNQQEEMIGRLIQKDNRFYKDLIEILHMSGHTKTHESGLKDPDVSSPNYIAKLVEQFARVLEKIMKFDVNVNELVKDFNSALRELPFSMKIDKMEEIVRKDKGSLGSLQAHIKHFSTFSMEILLEKKRDSDVRFQAKIYKEDKRGLEVLNAQLKFDNYTWREPKGFKEKIEEFASIQLNRTQVIDYYSKRLAIESSLIEDALASTTVFDSTTVQKIFAAANPDQTICRGVLVALNKIKKWIINRQLDEKKLFEIHHDIVRNSRIHGFSECPYVIPINEYRHVNLCCESTVYPNWEEVDYLMQRFFEQLNLVIKDEEKCLKAPFTVASYIHQVFVMIHPFVDGNGRLGRILASIPLLIAHLPPAMVLNSHKNDYFDAIQKTTKWKKLNQMSTLFASHCLHVFNDMSDNKRDLDSGKHKNINDGRKYLIRFSKDERVIMGPAKTQNAKRRGHKSKKNGKKNEKKMEKKMKKKWKKERIKGFNQTSQAT